MSSPYDVIVLGAGPNGLTAAAYLAAAGLRVALVERSVETGGGLVTQELAGFRLNHHATYMLMAELLPPYRDLDLAERGVQFVRPDVQAAFLFERNQALILYTDPDRTRSSVEALSPDDGARFMRMYDEFEGRLAFVREAIVGAGAQGVILVNNKFCDLHGFARHYNKKDGQHTQHKGRNRC